MNNTIQLIYLFRMFLFVFLFEYCCEISLAEPQKTLEQTFVIDNIQIKGNRFISSSKIMAVVKTRPGDKFDRRGIRQDLESIYELGYFDGQSLQATPTLNDKGISLVIYVQEKNNAKIQLQNSTITSAPPIQFGQYYIGGWNGVRGYRQFLDPSYSLRPTKMSNFIESDHYF